MIENGFYKIKPEFFNLINNLGGKYSDRKQRPVFCCVEDSHIKSLYWAIPTSDLSHRSIEQIDKIKKWCNEPGIRSAYYHIGYTNRPALYKISDCFPITEKYVDSEYISQGIHLILKNKKEIQIIRKKLSRILFDESLHPDKYEQHITSVKNYLEMEIRAYKTEKGNEKEKTPFNDYLVQLAHEKDKDQKRQINVDKDQGIER